MIMLRIVFFVQLALLLPAFVSMIATQASFGTLALFFYLLPVGVVTTLYALWQFFRHPARRQLAVATAATPLICLGGPVLYHNLYDGPVPPEVLIPAIAIVVLAAIYTVLGKTDQWRDTGLFASRSLNLKYLLGLCMLLALLWLPAIAWLAWQSEISVPSNIAQRDMLIRTVGYYYIAVAAPAAILAVFGLFYAPVGLLRNAGGRLLHLGQLAVTLMLLITLAAFTFVLFLGAANPG